MFNPAYPFTTELLDSFVNKEVFYFVKSGYERGINNFIRQAFLITHYHDQSEAQRHFNVIADDVNRVIYDIRNAEDLEKLRRETEQVENRQAFSRLMIPDADKKATTQFKEQTRRYLHKNTNWDLSGKVTIYPKLRFQLGQLFVRIAHEGDQLIIPFKDIENA